VIELFPDESLGVTRGLCEEVVESAITAEARTIASNAEIAGWFAGKIVVEGQTIAFRGYPLSGGLISVGTYFTIP